MAADVEFVVYNIIPQRNTILTIYGTVIYNIILHMYIMHGTDSYICHLYVFTFMSNSWDRISLCSMLLNHVTFIL